MSYKSFKTWLQIPRCSNKENDFKNTEYDEIQTTKHTDRWGGGNYQITGMRLKSDPNSIQFSGIGSKYW